MMTQFKFLEQERSGTRFAQDIADCSALSKFRRTVCIKGISKVTEDTPARRLFLSNATEVMDELLSPWIVMDRYKKALRALTSSTHLQHYVYYFYYLLGVQAL